MLRIALDTSTTEAALAIEREGQIVAESVVPNRVTHSETVLPELDRVLQRVGASPESLDAVVVGAGPGSFTGVRIAASVAKGLCFATGCRLYAYASLAAVAASNRETGPVCAMFDARRGEVYAAAYEPDAPWTAVLGPMVAALDVVLDRLEPAARWSFAGDGATLHEASIAEWGGHVLPRSAGVPRASALLWLARQAPELGLVGDVDSWEPAYVRLSGAQRQVAREASS